jgi:transcriptional regulator with XRE-family HTH domain
VTDNIILLAHVCAVKESPHGWGTMPELFGAKLRHIRARQHMTQVELARALGLSHQGHVSHLEIQRTPPSLSLVVKIANLLGVTTDYLLRDSIPVAAVADHLRVPAPPPAAPLHQFGTRLRGLRTQHGLKMNQLAAQLGLTSHSHLSHLEAGRKEPSLTLVLQLADRFGVTTDALLRDKLPPAPDADPPTG